MQSGPINSIRLAKAEYEDESSIGAPPPYSSLGRVLRRKKNAKHEFGQVWPPQPWQPRM